jgi:hypothetical protein
MFFIKKMMAIKEQSTGQKLVQIWYKFYPESRDKVGNF